MMTYLVILILRAIIDIDLDPEMLIVSQYNY